MSAFDLTQFNNINNVLYFKINHPPEFYRDFEKNISYTSLCLNEYDAPSSNPRLYGPDVIVITYIYWHDDNIYAEYKQDSSDVNPIQVLGYEYDKDIRPNWHDASSYYTRGMCDEEDY